MLMILRGAFFSIYTTERDRSSTRLEVASNSLDRARHQVTMGKFGTEALDGFVDMVRDVRGLHRGTPNRTAIQLQFAERRCIHRSTCCGYIRKIKHAEACT
jgi:hypothetical protein